MKKKKITETLIGIINPRILSTGSPSMEWICGTELCEVVVSTPGSFQGGLNFDYQPAVTEDFHIFLQPLQANPGIIS